MTILKQAILLSNASSSPVNNLLGEQTHHQLLVQSVDLPIDSGPNSPNVANGQLYTLQSAPVLEQLQPAQVILLHQSSGEGNENYNSQKNLSSNLGLSVINSPLPPSTGSSTAFSTSTSSSTSSSPMTGDLLIDDQSRSSSQLFGQQDTQLSLGESASQVPSTAEVPPATTSALSTSKTAANQQSTTTRQPGHNYGRFILYFICFC